jgi:hypothetical protein
MGVDYDFELNDAPEYIPNDTTGYDADNEEPEDESLAEFGDNYSDSEEELEVVAESNATPAATNTELNSFDFTSNEYDYDMSSIAIRKTFVSYIGLRAKGTSISGIDEHFKDLNAVQEEDASKFWSVYKIRKYITEKYPAKPVKYSICKNACVLFNDYVTIRCKICNEPRCIDGKPQRTMLQLHLKQQLAVLMTDEVTRDQMRYRSNPGSFKVEYDSDTDCSWTAEVPSGSAGNYACPNEVSDYVECAEYKKVKNQLFRSDYDVALGLFTDGFQVFKRSSNSMTIVHLVNLNMSPLVRKELKNMIQVAIVPSGPPNQDFHSFLGPVLDDLADIQRNPISVKLRDGSIIKFNAHLLFSGGDIPAIAKVCNHAGHQFRYGCRSCTVLGEHRDGAMTFFPEGLSIPAKRQDVHDDSVSVLEPEEMDVDDEVRNREETEEPSIDYMITPDAPFRTSESYKSVEVEKLPNDKIDRLGQLSGTPFADRLDSFTGFSFFPIDQMHLLMNMSKRIWGIIRGDYSIKVNNRKVPLIKKKDQEAIGELMVKSRSYTPTYFPGECKDISNPGFLRCIDWIHFGRYLLPTIVVEFLEPQHRDAFLAISTVISLLCQNSITDETSELIDENLHIWYQWLINPNNNIKLSVFSINHHHLDHSPVYLDLKGPMHYYSAWNMERAIREYKSNVCSTRYPDINAGNLLVELTAERRYRRLNPNAVSKQELAYDEGQIPHKTQESLPGSSDTLQVWSPFDCKKVKDVKISPRDSHFSNLLFDFLFKRDADAAESLDSGSYDISIDIGTRLWKSNKFLMGCSKMRSNKTRADYIAKLSVKVVVSGNSNRIRRQRKVFFGEVQFYFTYSYRDNTPHLLALVKVYQVTPATGKGLYHYIHNNASSKFIIVKAKDITDIVSYSFGASGKKYLTYEVNHHERKTEVLGKVSDLY